MATTQSEESRIRHVLDDLQNAVEGLSNGVVNLLKWKDKLEQKCEALERRMRVVERSATTEQWLLESNGHEP